MYKPLLLAAAAALLVPATASAAWSPPTTLSSADEADPSAQIDGSVLMGWLKPAASVSKDLGAPSALTAADPFETVWAGGLDKDGNAIVLTVRKHKPLQRIRAIFVAADGTRSAARTISDNTHSAAQPVFSIAPDGTAVAAWGWHDPAGWRAQVSIRRPGQPRFEAPQTVSPPAPTVGRSHLRPTMRVAAGEGGRAVITWQVQTGEDAPLHVLTAGADSRFGADQVLADGGRWADVAAAVSASGAVTVAYMGESPNAATSLRVAAGIAGAPLSEPVVLSTGGKGTSSGSQVAVAYSADGTPTVAWGKPGTQYEDGGTLEVFPGAAGPPQTLAEHAEGIVLSGGPGNAAALAWMTGTSQKTFVKWVIHAALRPVAGGAFGADEVLSGDAPSALWPSIAVTPGGRVVASWVVNGNGGGSGNPTAAVGTL